MIRARWLAVLFVVACSPRSGPRETALPRPVVAVQPSEDDAVVPTAIVAVQPKIADAPWLERPIVGEARCPLCETETIAIGASAALVRTDGDEVFANVVGRGVMGPLALPADRTWIGLGGDDRPFVADAAGWLWSADDLDAARTTAGWRRRAQVAAATSWDIAPGRIVATDGARVYVSTDGGESFVAGPRLGRIAKVLVRHDGVIAALSPERGDEREIRLSRDEGRTWKRSALRVPDLVRVGAWLTNDESLECTSVLAADGRTWVRPTMEELHAKWNSMGWSGAVQTSEHVDAFVEPNDHETFTHPPAPAVSGHAAIRGARACAPERGGGDLAGGVAGGFMNARTFEDMAGVVALRRSSAAKIPATTTDVEWFRDAVCTTEHGGGHGFCRENAPLARAPHIARIDRASGRVRVEDLPPGCKTPQRAFAARGLGVLLCRDADAMRVFAAEPGGPWRDEGPLAVRASDVWNESVASDGTLLLQLRCRLTESCRALVRAPVSAGDARGWWIAQVPGAVTYRPVPNGSALAIVQPDAAIVDRMHVVVARPGADPKLLADAVLDANTEIYDVEVLEDGRVLFEGGGPEKALAFFVQDSGALVPTDPVPPRKTADGVIISEVRPLDPALVE